MIRSNAGRCPISAQCRILGVAKSTYYWMLEHPEAERADPYEKDVERMWRDSGKVYGARKIKHALGHDVFSQVGVSCFVTNFFRFSA